MEVHVTDYQGFYQVWVDGKVYDTFSLRRGPRLTFSQMIDVAAGYREALLDTTSNV